MSGPCRVLLVLLSALLVAGAPACGSPSGAEPDRTVAGTAPTSPAASPAASPSTTTEPTEQVGAVSPEDLCAFVGGDLPKLREQSGVGTLARLADDVGDFYAQQGLRRPDGAAIDEALRQACPDVRQATLVAVNQPDLRAL